MLQKPITSSNQNLYKQKLSFYKATWKVKDRELIKYKSFEVNGKKIKEWRLTLDGMILARILIKSDDYDSRNKKQEPKS